MALERARRRKFAELVTDHGFGNVYGHVLATIVHGNGVTHHVGEDGRGALPRLDDVLFASFVHRGNAAEKTRLDEMTLLQTSAHGFSLAF